MSESTTFNFLHDLFSPFGEITIRKMFGGAGVYCDGTMFSICSVDDTAVWLKVDDVTRSEFESAGLKPFVFEMSGKTATMSYYNAPEEIFDDHDALRHWTALALGAAARTKKPKKKPTRKRARTRP
ncbi:MAG: TfoX/Sxy family protein [Pseudomonadota bacterium]